MKLRRNKKSIPDSSNLTHFQEESTDYETLIPWKNSHEGNSFFQWFLGQFKSFEEGIKQSDRNIYFFKNESTFAFRINTEILDISPSIVWNYWKDEIQDCGYILKNSEEFFKNSLTTKRYYLKPRLKFKIDRKQLFGNITLEFIKNQAKPAYIMLKCTWYKDQNFSDQDHYSSLIQVLTV